MKTLIITIVSFWSFLAGCTKDGEHRPYSLLNVRFLGDEEDIRMETVQGDWSFTNHTATITATGYKFESFFLHLPQVVSTGIYPNISIDNISLSDGLDFLPLRLTGGSITITYLDSVTVRGEFRVSLEDEFNGAENRTIIGGFSIYQ